MPLSAPDAEVTLRHKRDMKLALKKNIKAGKLGKLKCHAY